jgi:tRNA-dihydrouridine synthase B
MALPKFKSKVFLAPLAGVTDPAFRLMCKEQGAGLVFTELTSIHALDAKEKMGKKELLEFIQFSDDERPVGVQLFGNDINLTKKSAQMVEPYFDIIDFNLGCPAQHITAQMAGSALLQKPEHMEKLLSTLVSAVNKPISIKMRAGVEKNKELCFKIGKIAEDVGVSMITLHPRTVEQMYSGKSDWSLIRRLKEKVSIPVVGNGDILRSEDAKRMFDETGCDYVMIGRAAMGNPFIFKQTNDFLKKGKYDEISSGTKKEAFLEYAKSSEKYNVPFPTVKNQAMYFSKGIKGGADFRRQISVANDIEKLRKLFS